MPQTPLQSPLVLQTGERGAVQSDQISLRIFSDVTDRRSIYRLRYRAYLSAKLIDASEPQEFSDDYDDLSTTKTVGAFYNDVCVGSLRLAFGRGAAPKTMPCQSIFSDVDLLSTPQSGQLVEFTRMVVDPEINNNSFRSTLYGSLVRGGMLVCKAGGADYAFIAVMPKMMRFYQFMCGFDYLSGPRPYPGVTEDTNLMGRNFRKLDARRSDRNAFFRISSDEIEQVRTLFQPGLLPQAA